MSTIIRSSTLQSLVIAGITFALFIALIPMLAQAEMLSRQLQIQMSGSDVSTLQSFLAEDTTIYPQGLVTGYFGFLTKAAVANYQSRNGIDAVGRVGPITLASINAQMSGGAGAPGADVYAPVLSTINVDAARTSATLSWSTNEATKGLVYYSTSVLTEYEYPHYVTIGGTAVADDASLHTSHTITIGNLQPNTTYYYDVYVTDAAGNASMSMQTTFHTSN